jgi:hypothetical protein
MLATARSRKAGKFHMVRLFTMASILALAAACAPGQASREGISTRALGPEASRDPGDLARPGGAPMPANFNPLGTTISPRQGSGAGGF